MSIYLVTVDPGILFRIQPQSFFVDAPNPIAAYDMFWDKCIHDPNIEKFFRTTFVEGDPQDGFTLKKENFRLWESYWGKKDYRVYHEVSNTGDPSALGMKIIVNKIPTQIKAGYKIVKGV